MQPQSLGSGNSKKIECSSLFGEDGTQFDVHIFSSGLVQPPIARSGLGIILGCPVGSW